MGTKRSSEELMGFSVKQPKLVPLLAESHICCEAVHDADVKGNHNDNSPIHKELEEDSKCLVSESSGKLLDHSSSSASEEDSGSGSGVTVCPSVCLSYFDLHCPTRGSPSTYSCDDDTHSSILHVSPRKHVPLGPNHQAMLPAWNPRPLMVDIVNSDLAVDDDLKVGEVRNECTCYDAGSVRCVQQHIKEARDKLREVIGYEKFEQLGLYDMGEEVALNWTEEEEFIFHEVVYGNPVSHDKNFWKHLSLAFPYRTKKEIVSYYFNVFILRRRAAQNRSKILNIDSDSDEWQGINYIPCRVMKEDDISLDDVAYNYRGFNEWISGNHISSELMTGLEDDDDDSDLDDDTDHDEDDTTIGNAIDCKSVAGSKDVKQQQHASFESQHNNFESWNGSAGENEYLLDVCAGSGRIWEDRRHPIGGAGVKDHDLLLPTCNMIEEFFGKESSNIE